MYIKQKKYNTNNKEEQKDKKKSSWQNLSKWYDSVISAEGSDLHQKLVIPQLLNILNLKAGMNILDIGCGNGVLAKHITKFGANYYGIDSSSTLIFNAKQRNLKQAKFFISDICNNKDIFNLKSILFDKALFVLSIQDINDLDMAIKNASSLIKDKGEIIIFMLHPVFKTPRQTGFVFDFNRKMLSRRIDSYLTPNEVPFKHDLRNKRYIANFYHKPLQEYINTLSRYNFLTKNIFEIPTYKEKLKDLNKMEIRVVNEIPMYMIIKAVKV